ncbi:hypothetical protein ACWEJ7_10450 [Streptomyces albidoflavus]
MRGPGVLLALLGTLLIPASGAHAAPAPGYPYCAQGSATDPDGGGVDPPRAGAVLLPGLRVHQAYRDGMEDQLGAEGHEPRDEGIASPSPPDTS